MSTPVFIIEHLEPKLWAWCLLEYQHISRIVGKEHLWFTNVTSGAAKLRKLGTVFATSASQLKLDRACILDAEAPKTLKPEDAAKFTHLVFGGILGDHPPRGRTRELRMKMPAAEARNLGRKQMSTDTAVLVTKMILDGTPLHDIPFTEDIEIEIRPGESVYLPYKYVAKNGKPVLPQGLVEMLRKQKSF